MSRITLPGEDKPWKTKPTGYHNVNTVTNAYKSISL